MTNKVMQNKTQKQIAVIGGGLSGVCTAYFLALAGFEVAVLERRGNVAEEASFGNSGLLAPGAAQPLVVPGLFSMAAGGHAEQAGHHQRLRRAGRQQTAVAERGFFGDIAAPFQHGHFEAGQCQKVGRTDA